MSPNLLLVIVTLTLRRVNLAAAAGRFVAGIASASDSVLMLTTAGLTCLTICEKPFESEVGDGITRGFASVESTDCCSLPLTPAGYNGAGDDADREHGQESERRGEAAAADAIEQARRSWCRCFHRKIRPHLLVRYGGQTWLSGRLKPLNIVSESLFF